MSAGRTDFNTPHPSASLTPSPQGEGWGKRKMKGKFDYEEQKQKETRKLEKEIEKSETIWSQRRSIAENNYAYRLEENDIELNVGDTYVPKITVENIENYQLEYQYDEDLIKIENDEIICLSYGTCEIYISIINCDEVEPLVLYLNIISFFNSSFS